MESVLGRYRNLIILVGVLFLQILGLAVQVKRSSDTENTRLIRVWAVDVVTPFERVLIWAQSGVDNVWHNYIYLRGVRAENRQLKDQIEQLRLEQVRLNEDAVQAHRLQALLSFKERFISKTVAAQVIGSSGSDSSRMIYIDKGEEQGLKRDMAVITADGIVGKVLQTYSSVSQVLLINDQSSGVGTILEKSRLQGFLKGTANGEVALEGVMSDEQVVPGERVLSSGGDQIFPKGLPIGTVSKVSPGKDLFLNIRIKPAVDLSKLEEVLVVVERQQRQATSEEVGRVRAADILAQRLPSVPDKPAEKPAAGGNGEGAAVAGSAADSGGPSASGKPVVATKGAGAKPVSTGGDAVLTTPAKGRSGTVPAAGQVNGQPSGTQPPGALNTTLKTTPKTAPNTSPSSAPAGRTAADGQPSGVAGSKPGATAAVQPKVAQPKGANLSAPDQPSPVQPAPVQTTPVQPDPANSPDSPN